MCSTWPPSFACQDRVVLRVVRTVSTRGEHAAVVLQQPDCSRRSSLSHGIIEGSLWCSSAQVSPRDICTASESVFLDILSCFATSGFRLTSAVGLHDLLGNSTTHGFAVLEPIRFIYGSKYHKFPIKNFAPPRTEA